MNEVDSNDYDVIVIGGGQAGLSAGYYLGRRTDLRFLILDAQTEPGGAWLNGWNSLQLFSPASASSLPGWMFPGAAPARYPTRDETIAYLAEYERRYKLPVERPIKVGEVRGDQTSLIVAGRNLQTNENKIWRAKAVISATGSWRKPVIPAYPGQEHFTGVQIHSGFYRSPASFIGQTVLVVGAGNSGAQIMAEVSQVATAIWVSSDEPQFLPDDIDGRVLFDQASERYRALVSGACGVRDEQESNRQKPQDLLGNIVMVQSVAQARTRGALSNSRRLFNKFTETGVVWADKTETAADAVIWCTGFESSLGHLRALGVIEANNLVHVSGTRSVKEPRLWLVGYGNWTGFASATLIGVGRTARKTVEEISALLV